jgi:uncharacterized protein YndB with AHSA1/START domain
MLTVLLYILVIILLLVLVLVIFAMTKPNEFAIRRAISIHAPPERVYALVNDFREWPKWSPWEKLDPALKRTHSGAESGKGSVYAWEGNKQAGAGRMEIVDSVPPSRIDIKLSFFKPFNAENRTLFTFVPAGDGTNVTWEMSGINNLMFKMMGIVMNMDKMIGRDFEKGLAAMKAEAEKPPSEAITDSM